MTPCDAAGTPHADVNGDGIVDLLDWSFIQANYLVEATQPGCCLDNVAAFAVAARTSVSVNQLFRWRLGHLAVADLNRDGHVDDADIALYNSGVRPIHPKRARINGTRGKRPTR